VDLENPGKKKKGRGRCEIAKRGIVHTGFLGESRKHRGDQLARRKTLPKKRSKEGANKYHLICGALTNNRNLRGKEAHESERNESIKKQKKKREKRSEGDLRYR